MLNQQLPTPQPRTSGSTNSASICSPVSSIKAIGWSSVLTATHSGASGKMRVPSPPAPFDTLLSENHAWRRPTDTRSQSVYPFIRPGTADVNNHTFSFSTFLYSNSTSAVKFSHREHADSTFTRFPGYLQLSGCLNVYTYAMR